MALDYPGASTGTHQAEIGQGSVCSVGMNWRTAFRLGAGLLILAAVVHVATVWPRVSELAGVLGGRSWLIVAGFAVSAVTALGACGLAAFLLWKAPDRPDARALILFLAFLAIFWGSLFRFLQVESGPDSVGVNLSYGGGWLSQSALGSFVGAVAAFLCFSALFPRPLTPERLPPLRVRFGPGRVRRLLLRPAVVTTVAVIVLLAPTYLPGLAWRLAGSSQAPEGVAPPGMMAGLLAGMFLILGFALGAILLGGRNLIDSYRTASPDERGRILWVVAGFNLATWMVLGALGLMVLVGIASVDSDALGAAIPLALVLAPLVLVVSAAVGILYSGAIDPGLVLQRSTLYGALGALGVIGFAAIESAVSEALEGWLGLPGFAGSVATGVLVTVGLLSLRSLLGRAAPRVATRGSSHQSEQGSVCDEDGG